MNPCESRFLRTHPLKAGSEIGPYELTKKNIPSVLDHSKPENVVNS